MKRQNDYINLLPRAERKPSLVASTGFLVSLAFVVAWLAVFGWQAKKQHDLKEKLAILNARKQVLSRLLTAERRELGLAGAGLSLKKLSLIKELLGERVLWSEVFQQFSQIVPRGVWFDSLEGNADGTAGITIKGGAYTYAVVSTFMLALQKTAFFENPQLVFAQKTKVQGRDVVGFEIVCGVKKAQGGP
jgi:Tfp pilus assembly protein PilN